MADPITWALTKVAEEAFSYAMGALFDSLFGAEDKGPSNADIMKELQGIVARLVEIDQNIRNLQVTMDDGFFYLKVDSVQNAVERIESYYTMYISAVKSLGKPDQKAGGRASLTSLGVKISQEIYPALREMNTFLVSQGNQSLVALAVAQSFRNSYDLVQHFVRVRRFLCNYLSTQLRGIILLNMAWQDRTVPFAGAEELIAAAKANLGVQEAFFVKTFGPQYDNLARTILEHPEGVHISISTEPGNYWLSDAALCERSEVPSYVKLISKDYKGPPSSFDIGQRYKYKLALRGGRILRARRPFPEYVVSMWNSAAQIDQDLDSIDTADEGWVLKPMEGDGLLYVEYIAPGEEERAALTLGYKGETEKSQWGIKSFRKDLDRNLLLRVFLAAEKNTGPHVLNAADRKFKGRLVNGQYSFGLRALDGRPQISDGDSEIWVAKDYTGGFNGRPSWLTLAANGDLKAGTEGASEGGMFNFSPDVIFWSTKTAAGIVSSIGNRAELGSDGILRVYSQGGNVLWSSQ